MMKKLFFVWGLTLLGLGAFAQTAGVSGETGDSVKLLAANRDFAGAKSTSKVYHAIYQLDTKDPMIIHKAIRNINNALNDPRLKGHVQLELICFAGGTDAVLKTGEYEKDLKALVLAGVTVAQCANSLREKNIPREQIFDFVAVVPSGNGELIIRQDEGWAVIKP